VLESDYLLEVKDVTKVFPGTRALNKVQLQVKRGEIHALCGENGAGKSTLMNIIGGIFPATEGTLLFEGNEIAPRNPREAQNIGIGFVHQELSLCPHLTVAENIFIGRLPQTMDMIDFKSLWSDADVILAQFSANFSSKRSVGSLTVSEQQLVEIGKSISLNCKLLILDEPTSSLTDKETTKLFEVVRALRAKGISILFISHRMAEIFELCDRVSVFKDGGYVSTMNTIDVTTDDVIRAMVGRELGHLYPPKSDLIDEKTEILKVENLGGTKFTDISFTLHKGEILGFAGLVGAGRSEIMRGLCGIDPVDEGSIILNGEAKVFKNYRSAVNSGICYLTEDRKHSGLFSVMSIRDNMVSANLKGVSRGIWFDNELGRQLVTTYVERLNIKIPGIDYSIMNLSGGNQQKCLVGKWLSVKPKVLIMDEPTRGIDVGAKAEIHNLLRKLASDGVGIIVVSSELPEVIGLSDRIAVIHEGSLMGFLSGDRATEENVMMLASGKTAA
ncbi:MAG: sugar ABC transporter ATP-binding protein, partial [Treponema sp.]|nr:sugar ABC transporter ATP-binding protein [Treponema sp.]